MYDLAYVRPGGLAEATALLEADENATALAGGQTLLPVLRARLASPSRLVDVARLAELKGMALDGDRVVIGAAETHAAVSQSPVVAGAIPALGRLAGGIGDPQVRNRGTLGGAIANNDPAACYPSAALALDAVIRTTRREIAAADFFTDLFSTALEPGELVTAVMFPRCAQAAYVKFPNPASRFALIGVFAARTAAGMRIAVTGAGAGVFRWREAELRIDAGGGVADLDDLALPEDAFTSDLHGSADYRMHLARVMTGRAIAAVDA